MYKGNRIIPKINFYFSLERGVVTEVGWSLKVEDPHDSHCSQYFSGDQIKMKA